MLAFVRKLLDSVDTIHKIAEGLVLIAVSVLPHFAIRSATLTYVIVTAGLVAGLAGYYFIVAGYIGKGRERCLKARRWCFAVIPIGIVSWAAVLIVIDPATVGVFPALSRLREVLLEIVLIPNALVALSVMITVVGLTGAITLSSKRLWTSVA